MKKLLLFLALAHVSVYSFSQELEERVKPDMEAIATAIADSTSDNYYPKLLKRYKALDTNLTLEQYQMLYYGFALQPEYLDAQRDDYKMLLFVKQKDLEGIKKEAKYMLFKNPFCLLAIYELSYVNYRTDSTKPEWRLRRRQYNALRKTIIFSGDGQTKETAFKVLSPNDEYNIISDYFHIKNITGQTPVDKIDKFDVEPSATYPAREIYFDISSHVDRLEKLEKTQTK
jgi:hypothetical protein